MKTVFSKTARVVCMLLALVLALSLFAGCKSGNDTSSKESASQATTSLENTEIVEQYQDKKHERIPETADLGGFEMMFAVHNPKYFIPEEGETAEGDLRRAEFMEVQKNYNCKILIRETTDWNEAMAAIVAGEEYANVIMPLVNQSGKFVQSRLCSDYLDPEISQYIDMSDPWWNDTMAYAANVLGKVYAGYSALGNAAISTWVVFFNKRIATEVGIKENELYDLWKNKEWTWDAMASYAKKGLKDLDGSGAMDSEEDQWGFVAPGYDCAQAFASSAKVASITTENGMNPTYSFNTSHCISTITKLNNFFTTEGFFKESTNYRKMFADGKCLFVGYQLILMQKDVIREMEDEWGVLPIPLGPKDGGGWQDKYMSRVDHNVSLGIIPATVENKEYTALIYEALSYNCFQITNKEVETMALSYCSDDTAIEVSNATYNTSTFEISQFFHSVANGGYTSAVESIMTKVVSVPNLDVSGLTMSVAVQAQQIIDDYFNGV